MRRARSNSEVSYEAATRETEHCTPPELSLPADVVHLWRADLNIEAVRLRCLKQNLSTDERARAACFRFVRDRERFVAARGLLREILALYLNTKARCLSFGYGAHGKPFLINPQHSDLRFNMSHSLDIVLVALAYKREVGVDIEHMRTGLEVEAIAETVLSTPEKRALNRLDREAKRRAFLRFWTRKEAYIKADGRGVSLPLEYIDVSAPTGQVAMLDKTTGEWRAYAHQILRTLANGPDYAAALAVEGRNWRLVRWQWPYNPDAI